MFAKEIKKMVPIDYVSNYKTWMSESAGITTCSVNVAPEGQFFFYLPIHTSVLLNIQSIKNKINLRLNWFLF